MTEFEIGVSRLLSGGIVVYPTDTLYALGAFINSELAVQKVYNIKKRPFNQSLPVAVADVNSIETVAIMNKQARLLAQIFLPGPLTLVLKKRETVSSFISQDTVAVRVPNHPIACELIKKVGPLTVTSANLHHGPPPVTIHHAKEQLGNQVACYLDAGPLGGIPSTIVDVSTDLSILREGAIKAQEIYAYRN